MNINDYKEDYQYGDFEGKTGWTEEEKQEATEDMLRSRFDCGQITDENRTTEEWLKNYYLGEKI